MAYHFFFFFVFCFKFFFFQSTNPPCLARLDLGKIHGHIKEKDGIEAYTVAQAKKKKNRIFLYSNLSSKHDFPMEESLISKNLNK